MKITLISFATNDWNGALKRIDRYSKSNDIFYKTILLNQDNIEKYVNNFYKNNDYLIKNYNKYPFMGNTWKTEILQEVFEKEKDSDFFLYFDAGNEFNINTNTLKRFYEYFEIADSLNILSMINRDNEKSLTHCSVINRIYPAAAETNQRNTGTLFIRNNPVSLELINEWSFYIKNNNYENILVEDLKCCDMYYKNLYDQSVFSCVLKKNNVTGIADEFDWYFDSQSVFRSLEENAKRYPIFNARNKNEYSLINKCVKYHDSIKHTALCNYFGKNQECSGIEITRKV